MPKWKDRVCGKRRGAIQEYLEFLLAKWLTFGENKNPERRGFVCSLVHPDTRELLMPTFYVGDVDLKTAFECGFIHLEKGARLLDCPNDCTSANSASPEPKKLLFHQRQYAGGIRCDTKPLLVLTSALPWEGDQSIGVGLGDWFGAISPGRCEHIADESGDSTFMRFIKYCNEPASAIRA